MENLRNSGLQLISHFDPNDFGKGTIPIEYITSAKGMEVEFENGLMAIFAEFIDLSWHSEWSEKVQKYADVIYVGRIPKVDDEKPR